MVFRLQFIIFILFLIGVCTCPEANQSEKGAGSTDQLDFQAKHEVMNEEDLVNSGMAFCSEQKYADATRCFDIAIAKNPAKASHYEQRGKCYYVMGHLDKAISDFKEAVSHDESNKYYRTILEQALFIAKKRDPAAVTESTPSDATARELSNRASSLCAQQKVEEALPLYTEAIARCPEKIRYLYYKVRGHCYVQMGDRKNALSDYQKSVELDADSGMSATEKVGYQLVILCLALFELGKHEVAKREILALNDFQLMKLGNELLKRENTEDAFRCFTLAINKYPKTSCCYEHRGRCHRMVKNLEKALVDFKEAVKVDPSCIGCWIDLGEIFLELGDLDEAKKVLGGLNFVRIVQFTPAPYNERIIEFVQKIEEMEKAKQKSQPVT